MKTSSEPEPKTSSALAQLVYWANQFRPTTVAYAHQTHENKIVAGALDAVVICAEKASGWVPENKDDLSPSAEHLALCLQIFSARRDNYYGGQVSGKHCNKLMESTPEFCDAFLHSPIDGGPNIVSILPSTLRLDRDLRVLAEIYNGGTEEGTEGLKYFLMTQKKWTPEMKLSFPELVTPYIEALKTPIWRPAEKPKPPAESSPEESERYA